MNTITITVPLTAENLKIIGQFTETPITEVPAPIEEKHMPTEETPEVKPVTKTEVRAAALVLAKAGRQEKLKEIFAAFNAEKLSDIATEDYPALLKKLNTEGTNG